MLNVGNPGGPLPAYMGLPWYLSLDSRPWDAYTDGRYPVLTLDFETTNLEHGDSRNPNNQVVLTAVKLDDGEIQADKFAVGALQRLSGKPCVLVAHNAKFELGWLNRMGYDTSPWLVWDTMIAEYVLAGNRRVPLDLDSSAGRYGLGHKGRLIDRLMKGGVCPSEMPDHMLRERVMWDVDKTYKLYRLQLQALAEMNLIRVQFTRCILTPVLAAMEPVGMTLDRAEVIAEYERLCERRAELETALNVMAGGLKLRGPQLAELVYDKLGFAELTRRGKPIRTKPSKRFPHGQRVTDAATLDALVASTDEQRQFVKLRREYGKVDAAITKNIEFFYRVCEERDCRFVASFNQCRTGTHRLSSSGKRLTFKNGKEGAVQFQNMAGAYKRLFIAPPGYSYSEADGMGLEFRTAGSLARDPQILSDVTSGADIHRYTASVINRVDEDDVSKEQRQKAKAHTFKPLFGGMRGTKREMEYYEAFREKYRVTNEMQQDWTHEVLKTGKLVTATGLVFYWPGTRMSEDGWISNTPSIFDYPIQSLATGEIIPVSVVYLYWTCKVRGLDATMVNTIHDSVIGLVANKDLDKYHESVVECFLDKTYKYMKVVYDIDLYVPLGVEYRAGPKWGDGEGVQVSYPYKGN